MSCKVCLAWLGAYSKWFGGMAAISKILIMWLVNTEF
jgi:hypothetical protein